jgi:competence protein ComEC
LATLKGIVISPVAEASQSASIPWLETQSSFYLKTRFILSEGQWIPVSGTVRVQVGETLPEVRPGNTVLIYCWLSRFQPPPNPGQFNLKHYMARKGVYAAASVPIREGVEIIDPAASWIYTLRSWLYSFCEDCLLDDGLPDRDVRSLSAALLLGHRETLKPEIMAAFQKTNLAHYISLSGQNVGILAGSLWILLRTAGLPKRPRALLCIVLILIYALIVPSMPAINRAVFLSCFIFSSFLLRRRSRPINTLALSAIVLLLIQPSELFSMGWQLSFLSVLGILVLYEPVVFCLRSCFFYPVVFLLRRRFPPAQSVLHGLVDLTAVGVAAWLAIAGLLLYYFGSINPMSPIWTVLVFPFVLILLYAGYLKLLIAKLLPTVAAFLSLLIHYAARGFEESVLLLSKIDFCQIISRPPPFYIVALIYLSLLSLLFLPFAFSRIRWTLYLACVCFFLQPIIAQEAASLMRKPLELNCLSVGHGQAIVLSSPHHENILFDAGSISSGAIAQKTIVPFLQQRGISSLEAVYLSHGDLDHLNGLSDLAAFVRIQKLYANCEFLRAAKAAAMEQEVCNNLQLLYVFPEPVKDYVSKEGIRIYSIWPTQQAMDESNVSDNDASEVLVVEYEGRKILLCGDIELYAQQMILSLYPDLRVDVLVLPHHGSTVNLDERFVEHFEPRFVIASGSLNRTPNAWHPSEASAIKAFYTGLDGTVTIKIKADGTLSAAGFLSSK